MCQDEGVASDDLSSAAAGADPAGTDDPSGDGGAALEAQPKLLPARLSPFAPPDPVAEARTAERLRQMSNNMLRSRRGRIDRRLQELGLLVGESALAIPSVRGTGLLDIDRILRKVDALENAREHAKLEREAEGRGPLFGAIDLTWLTDAFRFREIRARRTLLVSELGLALCAADLDVIAKWAPHVRELLGEHVTTARRIDELFVEMRLLDDEFERRVREGLDDDPPKEIDTLISKALDSVDDVGTKAAGTIAELSKSAAKTAVTSGGQAVWGIVRETTKGALELGSRTISEKLSGEGGDGSEGEASEVDEPSAPLRVASAVVAATPDRPAPPPPAQLQGPSIPDLIRELAQLRDEGLLTPEEFAAKKAELLSRL
jgi:hypothetical protein